MQRLRDPKQVARKKQIHIDEVEALVNDLPRYGFINCCRIEELLYRLLKEAQTPEERSAIFKLAERFEADCKNKFFNFLKRLAGFSNDKQVDMVTCERETSKKLVVDTPTNRRLCDSSNITRKT